MSFRIGAAPFQALRHALRVSVLVFVTYAAISGAWRNYKVAHNNARIVGLVEGPFWEKAYDWNERLLSLWGEPFRSSLDFLGMPWAATVFGVPTADPILVGSHLVATRSFEPSLLLALVLPLGLAAVLGKVFCSHLCPARLAFELGQLVRGGLLRLGLPLPHLRLQRRFGGWVLVGGLGAAAVAGTGVWFLLLPYTAIGGAIFFAITAGTAAGLLLVPWILWVVDVLVAPGAFCHNFCPQGFLLEQLGRRAPWRVVQDRAVACPETCRACESACPYALSPRAETHRPACNNCGICVTVCPKKKLARRIALPVVAAALLLFVPAPAFAHHNKGLPHYGYFENYPQVPTEESIAIHGRWEMGGTLFNFQGYDRRSADTPNDVKFFIYLYDLESDAHYQGPVEFEIRLDGETVTRFQRQQVDEEMIYSTRETLPRTGEYEIIAHMGDHGQLGHPRIYFDIELGDGGINWVFLTAIGAPVLFLFGLALLGRTRRGRAKRLQRAQAATAASAAVVLWVCAGRAQDAAPAPPCHATMAHYTTGDGGQIMVMGGIPPWLLVVGVMALILASFLFVERFGSGSQKGFRLNLIKKRSIYRVVRSRWFQRLPQLLAVAAFGYVVYAGLFGSQYRNITPIAVWTLWWGGLVFAVATLGPAFCFACPWDGLQNLLTRIKTATKLDTLSLNLPVPRWLANMWPAIGLFVLLSWAELGLGITTDPRGTAYLGLGMAALAVGSALLFQKKAFCAHLCPVGRITGVYSNFAPVEIRARNPRACQKCVTEDCLHGNERGYPCPTGISLKVVQDATYCTGCTECIKSCDKHNVAFNLRPFAEDLHRVRDPRLDEAWLCLSLLTLTLFHGFTMTTAWEDFSPGEMSLLKWMAVHWSTPAWVNFTVGMLLATSIPIVLYWASCDLAARWTRTPGVTRRTLFLQYSFALLPVALFYHLAHNAMHLLMEGGHIIPLLSDPLGNGTDYFGTARTNIGHLMGEQALWFVQVGLILVGHIFGIVVAHRISRRLFTNERLARRSLVPMLAAMVLLSAAGLSLMALDMNMRAGRM